jgi:hypothetical protein
MTRPVQHPTATAVPIAAHFSAPLPRGLREEAGDMTVERFIATYGQTTGPVRLGQWECTDTQRAATRLGPQARNYRATIAIGDHLKTSTAAATGPVAALTAMLYEHGIAIETLNFHQLASGDHMATFIRGSDGARAEWAMGWAPDPTQSALRAIIACANRLSA